MKVSEMYQDIIGKTVREAEAMYPAHTIRIAERDGESLMLTMEFRFNRINVGLTGEIITKVFDVG